MAHFLATAIVESPTESIQDRRAAIALLVEKTRSRAAESENGFSPYQEYDPTNDMAGQYGSSHLAEQDAGFAGISHPVDHFSPAPQRKSASTRELQLAIRRKQKSQQRLMLAGVLGGALVLVGVSGFFFYKNYTDKQERIAMAEKDKERIQAELGKHFNAPPAPAPGEFSEDGEMDGDNGGAQMNGAKPRKASDRRAIGKNRRKDELTIRNTNDQSSNDVGALPAMQGENNSTAPNNTNAEMPNMTDVPTSTNEPMKPVKPEMAKDAEMEEMADKPMAAVARPVWAATMNAARTAMLNRDFERFNKEIEIALEQSGDDSEMLDKQKRLDRLGQVYQMGKEAFDKGFASLTSVRDLPYGNSSKAIVVEVTKDTLVLRIGGTNQRFPTDKLPMGIVVAIAELNLGKTPTELAIRGAIYQLHANSTDDHKKRALDYYSKAAAADPTFQGLERVLTDKYE